MEKNAYSFDPPFFPPLLTIIYCFSICFRNVLAAITYGTHYFYAQASVFISMLKSIHHSVCVCVCFCVCFSFFFEISHLTAISSGFEKKIWFKTIAFLVFESACEQKAMSLRGKKEKINLF